MQNEEHLRALIRRKIDGGVLPDVYPREVRAGYGCGEKCDACGQAISAQEVGYECEGRVTSKLYVHLRCHFIWQQECGRPEQQQKPQQPQQRQQPRVARRCSSNPPKNR